MSIINKLTLAFSILLVAPLFASGYNELEPMDKAIYDAIRLEVSSIFNYFTALGGGRGSGSRALYTSQYLKSLNHPVAGMVLNDLIASGSIPAKSR